LTTSNPRISTAKVTLRLKLRLKLSTRPTNHANVFDLGPWQA
jgi:hypothetical protein